MQGEKARVRALYERDAPKYDRSMGFFERYVLGDARTWAVRRARGHVLELAVGTGLNLAHYSHDVRLTGVELSPAMLALAKRRAAVLGRDADLRLGDAEQLDFANGTFDAVVCTYGLCTIPDARQAVREAARVLKPGGRLLLAEHVRSPVRTVRAAQRALNGLMVRFKADNLLREPLDHVRGEGFVVDELERARLGIVERLSAHTPS